MKNSSVVRQNSSIHIEDNLIPLKPKREMSKGRLRVVWYKKVFVPFFTPQTIVKLHEERNCRSIPTVIEFENYFIVRYENRAPIILKKGDGRLYTFSTEDLESAEKQASIFLEIIRSRVEGFGMRDIQPKVEWIEGKSLP